MKIPVKEFTDKITPHQWEVLRHIDTHPEIKHRILIWHRRARKTTLGVNILLRACVKTQNKTYAYISPSARQSKAIIWRDPMMLRRYMPDEILKKPFNETELVGNFVTGSVLGIGGADDPDRWRGQSCYGWVLDEFAMMRNGKMLYEEIIYPIIRENGGWVIFSYTPKGRGVGYEYYQKAQDNKNWKHWLLPVTESGILTDEQIEEARQEMPEHLFNQEMMCEFLLSGGGVINRIDEAITGQLEPYVEGKRYVMGVDLGKKVDWTVLCVLDRDARHLVAFERFQKFDWGFQKEKIARLSKEYGNPLIVMDSTGLGSPIEDDLTRMGLSVRGFQSTEKSKKHLIEKLILTIEDRRVTFPDIPELVNELRDFDIDERSRYGAIQGMHDDCVFSLALAIEGLGAEIYGSGMEDDDYQNFSQRFRT